MIPAWNLQGVIPPIRPGIPGHDLDRSQDSNALQAMLKARADLGGES